MSKQFQCVGQLSGHSGGVYCLTNDKAVLNSGSGDGIFASWNVNSLQNLPNTIKVGLPVFSCLHQNGLVLLGQDKGGIHVIDKQKRKELRNLQFHSKGVFDIQYNSKTAHFYSLGGGGSLSVFDDKEFRLLIQIPVSETKLRRALLSEDGSRLFVSSSNGRIHCFETDYFNELFFIDAHENGAYAMKWLDINTLISGGRDAYLRFWNWDGTSLQLRSEIPAHNFAIYDIAIIDHKRFASASRDKIAKVWDIDNLEAPQRLLHHRLTTHSRSVNAVHYFENTLITAGDDRLIKIWKEN